MTDGQAWTVLTRFEEKTDEKIRAIAINHFITHPNMKLAGYKWRPIVKWLFEQLYTVEEKPDSPQTYRGHRNRPLIKPRDENGNIIREPKEPPKAAEEVTENEM